jgi:uncharacterized protein with HEPN domain
MWRDEANVLDMLHACERALRHAAGLTATAFLADELRQDAILRQLIVLGEAATRISPDYRAAHPQIAWQGLAGLRDLVVRQHDRVDLPEIWRIVAQEVATLQQRLAPLVPPEPRERGSERPG